MGKNIILNIEIPTDITLINDVFKQHNIKLYLVGGCVRDSLLNIKPKDWDLVSEAIPSKVIEMFKGVEFVENILLIGESFGVVSLVTENDTFEIATFRSDGEYTNNRHPDSVTFGTIVEDSKRRDLTCNALFFDLGTSEIVDLVGGVEDLKNGIIRTVGNAEDRLNEDRLRILRAIRFAARFSNGLDSGIIDALDKDSSLEGISAERIRDEFLKGLKSANSTVLFLEMLDSFNLFDWIFPNMVVNKKFIEDKDPIVVLATLLKNHEWVKLRKDLNKLTFSTFEIKAIELLTALHKLDIDTAVMFKNILKNSGVSSDQLRNFGSREGIPSQLLVAFEEFELSVNGDEVMKEFNLKPSKELGDKIKELETNNFKKLLGIS